MAIWVWGEKGTLPGLFDIILKITLKQALKAANFIE